MFCNLKQRMTDTDQNAVIELSSKCGVSPIVAEVLYGRGYKSEAAMRAFLHPSLKDFHDPFLLDGMAELVDRIKQAIQEGETVAVYGDYDADGICATAIFTKYLTSKGVNVVPHIPSRKNDGYGVTLAALERIIEDALPDLILTCDCGISAYAEIAAVADSGIDFFVTDHHEAPDILPDCVCVDPKMPNSKYPFDGLCGAGVVLKLIQALEGVQGMLPYLDLAAVATVADLVPLVDENRTIVLLGLTRLGDHMCNPGLAALLGDSKVVTATDVAYRIAPRINAAGRMGDAYRAFRLLTEDQPSVIQSLAAGIDADNAKRKEMCAEVYREAYALIRQSELEHTRCLVLSHPDWEKGLTSIVAAQIAGEFKRPTFLVVKNGDHLKGTARSVGGINIYEVLRDCGDLLIEYGGHAQAAGFSIEEDHVDAFRARVNDYLNLHFTAETFLPSASYDVALSENQMTFGLAKDLETLEPFGNGNPRPLFRIDCDQLKVDRMKNKPMHLTISLGKNNISAFNMGRYYQVLKHGRQLQLNIELSVKYFQGRDYLSAILKDFDFATLDIPPETDLSVCFTLAAADKRYSTQAIDSDGINKLLNRDDKTGVLFVAYRAETYRSFCATYPASSALWHSLYTRETSGNFNRIVVAPYPDFDAFGYRDIVLLDGGFDSALLPFQADRGARVYVAAKADYEMLKRFRGDRETFVSCYKRLKAIKGGEELLKLLSGFGEEAEQFAAVYSVLCGLGLVSYSAETGYLSFEEGVRRNLSDSVGYSLLTEN